MKIPGSSGRGSKAEGWKMAPHCLGWDPNLLYCFFVFIFIFFIASAPKPECKALKFQVLQVSWNSCPVVPPWIWLFLWDLTSLEPSCRNIFLIAIIDPNYSLHFQIPEASLDCIQVQENNDEIQALPYYLSFFFFVFNDLRKLQKQL